MANQTFIALFTLYSMLFLTTMAYDHTVTFDGGNYIVSWSNLAQKSQIEFKVEARTTGWVGFGLTETAGGMEAMDCIVGGVASSQGYLKDYSVNGFQRPTEDGKQDYTLIGATETGGRTTLVIRRNATTEDSNDMQLTAGKTVYLVWSYNSNSDTTPQFSKHTSRGYSSQKYQIVPVPSSPTPGTSSTTEVLSPSPTTAAQKMTSLTTTTSAPVAVSPSPTPDTSSTEFLSRSTTTAAQKMTSSTPDTSFTEVLSRSPTTTAQKVTSSTITTSAPVAMSLKPTHDTSSTEFLTRLRPTTRTQTTSSSTTTTSVTTTPSSSSVKSLLTSYTLQSSASSSSSRIPTTTVTPPSTILTTISASTTALFTSATSSAVPSTPPQSIDFINQKEFPSGNCKVFWKYLPAMDEVLFKVEAATTGWIGLGLNSENPIMTHMDCAVGGVKHGAGYLRDYKVGGTKTLPPLDSHQDYTLISSSEMGGYTTLVFKRKRLTGDTNDTQLQHGQGVHVACAFSSSDTLGYHNGGFWITQQKIVLIPQNVTSTRVPTTQTVQPIATTTSPSNGKFFFDNGNYNITWSYNKTSAELELTCEVNAAGWIGIGFSTQNSGMRGLDCAVGGYTFSGSRYLEDFHADSTSTPIKDTKKDWTLMSATEADGKTTLVIKRKGNTGDTNDVNLVNNKVYVAWAYHRSTDMTSQTGFLKHTSRGYCTKMHLLATAQVTASTPKTEPTTGPAKTTSKSSKEHLDAASLLVLLVVLFF